MAAGKYVPQKGGKKENRVRGLPAAAVVFKPLNHEQERIRKWLKQVRFKKTVVGGVNEADVWKKIAELNTLYEAALSAERARYDALLAAHTTPAAQHPPARSAEHWKAGDEGYE